MSVATLPTPETGLVGCPEPGCGCNDTRPIGVVVNSGGQITQITSDGVGIGEGRPEGRGVSILLVFQCEAGHDFKVAFRFHKGTTEFEIASEGSSSALAPPIWRD